LAAIKLHADKDVSYLVTDTISAPYLGVLWDEGYRHPQMAYYHGKATDLVLLPVSNPQSTSLSGKDPEDLFSSWRAVIDSVAKNNDMALFVFRTTDVENPEYAAMFNSLFDYAQKSGMTTTTPEVIADHYRRLQKVSYNTWRELSSASINVTNRNPESISGVSFRVVMPQLEDGEYLVRGGKVANIRESGNTVTIYASVDLAPQETRTITIEPDIPRKELIVDMPEYIIENMVSIAVRGEDGQPVDNALVTIEGFPIPFETDADGIVQAELSRGNYKVTVEKAGYFKQSFTMEVRGRIYSLHHLIYDII
ncbi:carboxypeptidase-like regulatory domain-containing protein, partial [Methanocalculus sp.]|uniref:carboxypeptidase-like regulatory domain-containing protein n=1 Tax=Methanocalculus sp. TaxID=2004547 RepID=UPI0026100EEF